MFDELQTVELYITQLRDAHKQRENISPSTFNYLRRTLELIVHKYCPTKLSVIQCVPYPTDSYTQTERLGNICHVLEKSYDLVCSNA
jgi:hypothetical protein